MIKINVLLVLGTIERGEVVRGIVPKHILEDRYGITIHDRIRTFGKGHENKMKVRIVTKTEDIRGIRLEDWVVLEDRPIDNYHKVFSDKMDELIARKMLRGMCD